MLLRAARDHSAAISKIFIDAAVALPLHCTRLFKSPKVHESTPEALLRSVQFEDRPCQYGIGNLNFCRGSGIP